MFAIEPLGANYYNVMAANTVFGINAAPTNKSCALEIGGTAGALLPSRLTTAQRDALTPVDGMEVHNSSDKKKQARENGQWEYLSTAVGNRDPGSFTIRTGQYFLQ